VPNLSANLCALVPSPGKSRPQVATMVTSTVSAAIAGAGNVDTAVAAAPGYACLLKKVTSFKVFFHIFPPK